MQLDAEDGLILIETAIEKELEEKAWQLWVNTYPFMENPISFSEYMGEIKKEQMKSNQPTITAKEAIEKAERIRKAHRKGGD